MKVFRTLNSTSLPNGIGWSVALASLLAMIAFWLTLQIFLEGLNQLIHYKEFEQRVYLRESLFLVDEDLDTILNQQLSPVAEFVSAQLVDEFDDSHINRLRIVSLMREIVRDVQARNFGPASSLFKSVVDDDAAFIATNLGSSRESLGLLVSTQETLDLGSDYQNQIDKLRRRYSRTVDELEPLLPRYKILAQEFADLFSLRAVEPTGPLDPLPVYQSGVLAGLPQIDRLRDGLDDLNDLRGELLILRGEVKIKGDNAYERFNTALERYTTLVGEILTERAEIMERRNELSEKIQEAEKLSVAQQGKATQQLMKIILAHARPELGTFTGDLYKTFSDLSQRVGILPDLPQI